MERGQDFPAGHVDRTRPVASLCLASESGCGRLEAGRFAGSVYWSRIVDRLADRIDFRGGTHGRGADYLQEESAADGAKYRTHSDIPGDVSTAQHACIARQSRRAES